MPDEPEQPAKVDGRATWGSPTLRRLRSSHGAYVLHSRHDPKETTKAARAAFQQKWYDLTDASLPHDERLRRAECLRKAHFVQLAARSVAARQARAAARKARVAARKGVVA